MLDATVSGDLLGDLEGIRKRLTADQRTLSRDVARAARKALVSSVRSRRGTLSFSGMGTKLGARTRVTAGAGSATAYLDAVPAGAWEIAEHGRSVSVARRGSALKIGDDYAQSARATSGRPGLWDGAAPDLEEAVLPVLEEWADGAYLGGE